MAASQTEAASQSLFVTIIREPPLYTGAMEIECIPGLLFTTESVFNIPANGIPSLALCATIELPYRNNMNHISSIPAGVYGGSVKTAPTSDGKDLGWRIELIGTGDRLGVQIHVGNAPVNSTGCVLVGTRSTTRCRLKPGTSKQAIAALRLIYGQNNSRPINIKIV